MSKLRSKKECRFSNMNERMKPSSRVDILLGFHFANNSVKESVKVVKTQNIW